jgi:hypothetical protein
MSCHERVETLGPKIVVGLVDENHYSENGEVKAERRFLAVPFRRLPHRKPLSAHDHKTEEPEQKAERRADKGKALGSVETGGTRS